MPSRKKEEGFTTSNKVLRIMIVMAIGVALISRYLAKWKPTPYHPALHFIYFSIFVNRIYFQFR